ncbi:10827_t:CDS:2, partial [Paraglomus brasilianum]
MTIETQEFPRGDFYIKSVASPSGTSTTAAPAQNLVIDLERGFWSGSKSILARQKSNTDHDQNQLWRYDNGWIVHKSSNNVLEVEGGKVGGRLVFNARKTLANANNQRWIFTKEGHLALQNNPQLVLDIKGTVKETAQIVLADTTSKAFGKSGKSAIWVTIPINTPKSANAIGVLRIEFVQAKDVLNVDNWVPGGKSDPYVRVFPHGSNNIIATTRVIDDDLNPVWNEVHYLPIKQLNEKFIFELMDFNTFTKHKTLGKITFQVTDELVKLVKGAYVGTEKGIDRWEKLPKKGQLHYRAKFFPLSTLHQPGPDFIENLRKKPYDLSAFYALLFHQEPNGSFLASDKLANLFGLETGTLLVQAFKAECKDERAQKLSEAVWVTSMVIWFLKLLLKDYQSEWSGVYDRAERYISEKANNLEVEEVVFIAGGNTVSKLFNISLDQSSLLTRPTRKTVKISHIRRTFQYQSSNGAFKIDDDLAKLVGFKNSENLRNSINDAVAKRKLSARITQLETHVWVTIFMLYYYRYVAIDHRQIWINSYWSAYRWLWAQFGNKEAVEIDAFRVVKEIAISHYSVDTETVNLDVTWEKEIASQKVDTREGRTQSTRELVAKKLLGIARIHIVSAKKLPSADWWFSGGKSDPYVKITNAHSGWQIGKTQTIYNNNSPRWNEIFYIPVYEIKDKYTLTVYDYNALLSDTLLGLYSLELKDFVKLCADGHVEGKHIDKYVDLRYKGSKKGQLHVICDFYSFTDFDVDDGAKIDISTINIRHLFLLITLQRQDARNTNVWLPLRFNGQLSLDVSSPSASFAASSHIKVKPVHTNTIKRSQSCSDTKALKSLSNTWTNTTLRTPRQPRLSKDKITEEDRKKLAREVEEETETETESGGIIGIVRLKISRAKDLSKSSSFLTTTDPYVRIIDGSAKEVATTVVARSTRNPVWEE